MKRSIVLKAAILLILIIVYYGCMNALSPIIANELAMSQMQNTADSSIGVQLYTYANNYGWLAFILLAVLIFYNDIKGDNE